MTSFLRYFAPPAVLLMIVVLLWHQAVAIFQLPPYLMPGPRDVAEAAGGRATELAVATAITGVAAAGGYLTSLVVGTLVALCFAQSEMLRRSCYPYAIFLQTVPIVAIAPLIVIWFGAGLHSVVIIASVISLFPVVTNGTTGLIAVDSGLRELFSLHDATRWQTMINLQLPNAVPHLLTGAKTASGLAVVGAIVGEFFVGYGTQQRGLGFIILHSGPQLKTGQLFAATIASALLGVVMFATVSGVERWVLSRWYDARMN